MFQKKHNLSVLDRLLYFDMKGLSEPGAGGTPPPTVVTEKLSLHINQWADYVHNITTRPQDFQNFLRPCMIF